MTTRDFWPRADWDALSRTIDAAGSTGQTGHVKCHIYVPIRFKVLALRLSGMDTQNTQA